MTGSEAIIELLKGKKIRRQLWEEVNFWYLKDNKLCNQEGHIFNMSFNELIMGDDWEIHDGKFDFYQAVEKLKMGCKVKLLESNEIYHIVEGFLLDEFNNGKKWPSFDFNAKIWEVVED
jgi:hypothetical protein